MVQPIAQLFDVWNEALEYFSQGNLKFACFDILMIASSFVTECLSQINYKLHIQMRNQVLGWPIMKVIP